MQAIPITAEQLVDLYYDRRQSKNGTEYISKSLEGCSSETLAEALNDLFFRAGSPNFEYRIASNIIHNELEYFGGCRGCTEQLIQRIVSIEDGDLKLFNFVLLVDTTKSKEDNGLLDQPRSCSITTTAPCIHGHQNLIVQI